MRRPGTDRPGCCQGSMLPLRSGSGSQPGLILASGSDDLPVIFAPGQPVTRGAANGVLPAEGAPAPSLIRSGRTGGVSKREFSATVDVAKQPYPDKRITLWFEDKARIGQKSHVYHRWWTCGEQPLGLCDQRYTWVHLFGAVQLATARRFALVCRSSRPKR